MKIKELLEKAERFFELKKSEQEEKEKKREKLKLFFRKKFASLKNKIREADSRSEKKALKKQLNMLKKYLKKLKKK